jgi:hypothetical protein
MWCVQQEQFLKWRRHRGGASNEESISRVHMRKQRHSPLYCSFDSPCIVCRMFSFSVMGITTVLYRACYIPMGAPDHLKCIARCVVSFPSHISLHRHTHTQTHTHTHNPLYLCSCTKLHSFAVKLTIIQQQVQTLYTVQFQLNCLTMKSNVWHRKDDISYIVCLRALSEVQTT